jgi:hypothetical protein
LEVPIPVPAISENPEPEPAIQEEPEFKPDSVSKEEKENHKTEPPIKKEVIEKIPTKEESFMENNKNILIEKDKDKDEKLFTILIKDIIPTTTKNDNFKDVILPAPLGNLDVET